MKILLNRHTKGIRIEMLPLIDIVFLLLVFFIYAMLSMTVHRGIEVLLPTSETAEIGKQQLISVTVKADGAIFMDEQPTDLSHLTERLSQKAQKDPETGVILFADRALSYQILFKVMDQIRSAGISRISLQAEAETP
jgi:biopolymer transport protein ExbD